MGIPTRGDAQDHVNKKRSYGEWNKKTVSRILTRETYIGVWHYGKLNKKQKLISVTVPSIISREMFEAAQVRAVENKQRSRRNLKYEYLLSKQITCGSCGYKMTGITKFARDKKYSYYRCPAKADFDAVRPCSLPQFPTDKVDVLVWNWVKSFLMDPTKLEEGLSYYQTQQNKENAPLQERLAIINDLLADNRTQLERLLNLYLKGDFPEEMLIDHKNRLETTIKNLEIEKTSLVTHLEAKMLSEDQIRDIKEFAKKIKEGLEAADESFSSRRRIIEMLDVRATLTIEGEEKIIYAQCRLGDVKFSFEELEYYAKFWYNGSS
jgi:hypothetical protein